MELELGLPANFWSKVQRRPDRTGCWEWTARKRNGYGTFSTYAAGRQTTWRATRFILQASLGRKIGEGLCALHRCDNPGCVNPAHLYEGTQRQNAYDRVARGRWGRGTRPKLTVEAVREIRAGGPLSLNALAKKYGVDRRTITAAKSGRRWGHVEGAIKRPASPKRPVCPMCGK